MASQNSKSNAASMSMEAILFARDTDDEAESAASKNSASSDVASMVAYNRISAFAQNTAAPNQVKSAGKRGGGTAAAAPGGKKTKMSREQRNAREKERSGRIAKQIDDLRSLLSKGGVIVAKGTKSSVLSETANYINLLQQQQIQWEL